MFAQTQLVECTLTGAEIHLPSYFVKNCSASGTTASQPASVAIGVMSASAPSLAQSRESKPSICTAVGGLPDVTRARSTVIAWVPPPPATGMSCQPMPLVDRSCFSTLSAEASPPEVHQCRTSTSAAPARLAEVASAASAVSVLPTNKRIGFPPCLRSQFPPTVCGQRASTQGVRVRPIRICTVFTSRNSSSP